jgi:uncharacterized protein
MTDTFCVSITHSRDDADRATIGFMLANAAIAGEKKTMVFLTVEGVWCAVKGEAERIYAGTPLPPLKGLVDDFLAAGGMLCVCSPCMQKRGIRDDQLVDGARPAGGAALIEWLSEGSPCLCY